MGGLALKGGVFTRRYEREEFEELSIDLLKTLRNTFKRADIPLFYHKKPSFGDADILIQTDESTPNLRSYIEDTFQPNEIFHNGNCWSFDYKELQIDLITVSAEDYDSNLMYLSYNDMGNLIGRLAHMMGLKYGQQGLWYEHYFKNKKIGTIIISKNYPKIFQLLGISYERFEEGFDELTDIFEFVSKSPYFNPKAFQFDQLNKINRDRNKKRKSYLLFLEWLDETFTKDSNDNFYEPKDKSIYFTKANDFFPEADLITEVRKLEYFETKNLYVQSKFNGGQIMLKFGLKDKALGNAIEGFKKFIFNNRAINFETFVLETSKETIYSWFELYYDKSKEDF